MRKIKSFFNKFKIPTILGLSIIILGIITGIYLTLREQTFLSQAAPDSTPQNITLTNITEDSATVSWQTSSATISFITFGQNNPAEQTVLDDRDGSIPKPHSTHYVTIKNLLPKTSYQFKVVSGKLSSDIEKFQTAQPLINQINLTPIIGSVLASNTPVNEGTAYLSIPGAITQSAQIKTGGNFLIPLSDIRKSDLSDYSPEDVVVAKLTILADQGTASMLFYLKTTPTPLPPIKLGQNIDLTNPEETPQASPSEIVLNKYDLNGDGKINAADYAIISSCFNKKLNTILTSNILCTKADMNKDGKIDQVDLNLINEKFKELGVPTP